MQYVELWRELPSIIDKTIETPIMSDIRTTEKPSSSETAEGGSAGANLVPEKSTPTTHEAKEEIRGSMSGGQTGSAEEAADKLYEERIEDEYAKREGGA